RSEAYRRSVRQAPRGKLDARLAIDPARDTPVRAGHQGLTRSAFLGFGRIEEHVRAERQQLALFLSFGLREQMRAFAPDPRGNRLALDRPLGGGHRAVRRRALDP